MKSQRKRSNRFVVLAVPATAFTFACDPIRLVQITTPINNNTLSEPCVVKVLRSSRDVKAAGVAEGRGIWAELNLPEGLEAPENRPVVSIDEVQDDQSERALKLSMTWVGQNPTDQYRAHVERVMRELAQACVDQCSVRRAVSRWGVGEPRTPRTWAF